MKKLSMLVAAIMMISAVTFAKVPVKKQSKEVVKTEKTEKKEVKKVPNKHKKAAKAKKEEAK